MGADATFCFTDIAGSTRMLRQLGTAAYEWLLERHRALIRQCLAAVGGAEIDTGGDGFFIAFPDPAAALAFAAQAQAALGAEPWPAGTPLRVRIGLHRGEAQRRENGEYVGLTVHRAARVVAAAHGGQVLITEAVAAGTPAPPGCRLRPLGAHRVRDFEGPVELFQLVGPGLADGFPPLRAAREGHGLPIPRTALLGRDDELAAAEDLLGATGFVTLVGPSGVGKTRLALELGALTAPDYPGGCHLVELSTVAGPDRVLSAVASAIGARQTGAGSIEDGLVARLAPGPALLLLDSCELVLAGVARLAELLAARSPRTAVLATSLEPVRLPNERVLPVAPLRVSEEDSADPLASPAVRLLAERSEALGRPVDLEADPVPLAAIARRLDGMPLALELAAARVAQSGPSEVVAALDDRFALLTSGYRTAAPRHQTLEAAVAWAVDLLKPDDRGLLARLSRLLGRWDLAAAAEVAGGDVAALHRLADRSLITVTDDRLGLLDTIRAFAARELTADEGVAVDRRRAARLHADLVAVADAPDPVVADLQRRLYPDVLDVIGRLVPFDPAEAGLLAATATPLFERAWELQEAVSLIERCLEAAPPPNVEASLLAAQASLLALLGRRQEAVEHARRALAMEELDAPIRARALVALVPMTGAPSPDGEDPLDEAERLADGHSVSLLLAIRGMRAVRLINAGRTEDAVTEFRAVAEEAHRRGFAVAEAQARLNAGNILARAGRLDEAEDALVAGEQLAREAGMVAGRYLALSLRANMALQRGEAKLALALGRERLELADAIGDLRGAVPALSVIGAAAAQLGDYETARAAGERMAGAAVQTGEPEGVVVARVNLAFLAARHGDIAEAGRCAGVALEAAVGSPALERFAVFAAAAVAAFAGERDGATLLGAVGDSADITYLDPGDRELAAAARASLADALGEAEVAAASVAGGGLRWEDALALAGRVASSCAGA
ncbi:MAG TPA: adenylate/guanylate cyclase domain-containing protein [Acidimicrobiales bacterium]|nr:adenylate/guanylate cyclase domain-containing protein [Acidimicrobiales bacterium]